MIEQLFFWQLARGRNFSVATQPTKPFGGDVFAPLMGIGEQRSRKVA
jgi:hypothetical protein